MNSNYFYSTKPENQYSLIKLSNETFSGIVIKLVSAVITSLKE